MMFKVGQIWAEDETGDYTYRVSRVDIDPEGVEMAWVDVGEGGFYIHPDYVASGLFLLYQDVEETSIYDGLQHLAQRIRETIQPPSVAQAENQRLVSMALHRLADLLEEL